MSKHGEGLAESGYSAKDLKRAKDAFEEMGCKVDVIKLHEQLKGVISDDDYKNVSKAYVLIARNGLSCLLGDKTDYDLFKEVTDIEWDTKFKDRGKVKNKLCRHNLCFSETSVMADFAEGISTVVPYTDVPLIDKVRKGIPLLLGEKGANLEVEGNRYYDIHTTGISFHGDAERLRVIGVRVGASIPLHYMWMYKNLPVALPQTINIHSGDIYIMSEKATGNDWKKSSDYTLRHAAGTKYVTKFVNTKKSWIEKFPRLKNYDFRA
jgi:hypothetical protein